MNAHIKHARESLMHVHGKERVHMVLMFGSSDANQRLAAKPRA